MNIATLFTLLEKQASATGRVALDATILTMAQLALIQRAFGLKDDQYLTINGVKDADITESGDTVTIAAGTVNVFDRQTLGMTITFTVGLEVDFVLVIAMPKGWALTDSFTDLPGFPFSLLILSNSCFVYSTRAVARYRLWSNQPGDAVDLDRGLNLAAELSVDALSALELLLGPEMPSKPLTLCGAFEAPVPKALPVMRLNADLGIPAFELIHGLTIKGLELAVRIPEASSESVQDVVIGVNAVTSDLEFLVGLTENATALSVSGTPLPTYAPTIDTLAACTLGEALLPKGTTFSAFLPSPISDAFTSIQFDGFDVAVSLVPAKQVTYLSFSIGEKPGSSVNLGLLDLTGFTLSATWMDPVAADPTTTIGLTGQARIPLKILTEPFDFSISITRTTGWAISAIEASYVTPIDAPVTLASIIAEIAPSGTTIPDELNDLGFSAFLLHAEPAGHSLSCSCQGELDCIIFSQPFAASFCLAFSADKTSTGTDYTFDLSASFFVGETAFLLEAVLAKAGGAKSFQFTAKAENIPLSELIENLFADFDIDLSVLPEIMLSNVTINYNTPIDKQVGVDATFTFADTHDTGEFVLVATRKANWEFVAVLSLGSDKPLDVGLQLPLIGKDLAGELELKASHLVIASKGASGITVPAYPDLIVTPGVSFIFDLMLAGQPQSVTLPVVRFAPSSATVAPAAIAVRQQAAASAAGTLAIQKKIGPVFIDSIGIGYTNKALVCSVSGSIALGPLSMSLNGLSFGSSLTAFKPRFDLNGLGLSYSEPPLSVAGEFVNVSQPGGVGVRFEGGLVIGTGDFAVQAFGYYGNESGFSSMFIFADVAYDFGGPPAFFVTGIALGFGYNSGLTLPTIDEVEAFPFIEVLPTSPFSNPGLLGGANAPPLEVLDKILSPTLHDPPWVHEEKGSLWLAAGLTFTSFELVNSQALLMVSAGSELVIDLIGTSRATFPQTGGEVTYANIEMDLLVRFAPSEGVFSLQAALASSSYLLDPACVLTGGFAFFVWFEGRPGSPGSLHKDDFVLTLGGYNPGFTPPAHYPSVPVLGFHWTIDSTITIQGDAYFALTPAALMVGGGLEATYQSGNLKAWFDAHADVIIRWKPFWFDADIGIIIGASYTIDWGFTTSTLSVELGCDLELWGPATGGTLTLDFYLFSVTIPFGTPKNNTQNISGWTDVEKMLPDTGSDDGARNVLTLSPTAGLTPNGTTPVKKSQTARRPAVDASSQDDSPWAVRSTMFAFTTSSSIPVTSATVGETTISGSTFNVHPLATLDSGWNDVSSTQTVIVRDSERNIRSSSFDVHAVHASVPAALWGSPPEDSHGNPQVPDAAKLLVPNQLIGVSLQVKAPTVGRSAGAIDAQTNLACEELNLEAAVLPVSSSALPAGDRSSNSPSTISRIVSLENGVASSTVHTARQEIFNALTALQYAPRTNDPMRRFRDTIDCTLNAEPLLVN